MFFVFVKIKAKSLSFFVVFNFQVETEKISPIPSIVEDPDCLNL
jgi:hypothetical protein